MAVAVAEHAGSEVIGGRLGCLSDTAHRLGTGEIPCICIVWHNTCAWHSRKV